MSLHYMLWEEHDAVHITSVQADGLDVPRLEPKTRTSVRMGG